MICKNCGADIGDKRKCEYCDTVYFETFQLQEPTPVKEETPVQESKPQAGNKTRIQWLKPNSMISEKAV